MDSVMYRSSAAINKSYTSCKSNHNGNLYTINEKKHDNAGALGV